MGTPVAQVGLSASEGVGRGSPEEGSRKSSVTIFAENATALKTKKVSAAPLQSEICMQFSVFHTVFDVKFW